MVVALAALAGLPSACSETDASARSTTSVPPAEVPLPPSTSASPGSTAGPEPTGVPGLDSTEPFCAAWAGYAGTLQALGIAASFGDLPSDRFASLELAAAPLLVDVARAIDDSWPAELAAEHAAVVEQRMGPYVRRAERGVEALVAAGVGDQQLSELRAAWHAALALRDPEAPVIEVHVGADVQSALDAAGRAYDSAVTPFAQDPSLSGGGVAAPLTDEYLAVHCPDLASSGVGDAI